ncbi:MAG: ankyrin repeat domain-containing protein [Candidatus Thiodiazotropha sp.]
MKSLITLIGLMLILLSACSDQPNDQEADDSLSPPLLSAAESGDLPTIRKLLDENSPVDVKDACLWTPLMKAALNGHFEAAQRLLEAGADVNQLDKGGYSALMLAASNNHAEIVELLLQHGANINQIEVTGGWTALIWAAKQGHSASVEALLKYHPDMQIRDFDGLTAREWAQKADHPDTAALLNQPG